MDAREEGLLLSSCTLLAIAGVCRGCAIITRRLRATAWLSDGAALLSLVFAWYAVSIGFKLWNAYVLKFWDGHGFPFPLLMTFCHMCIKLCCATACLLCRTRCRYHQLPALSRRSWVTLAIPVGLFTAADVALSNLAQLLGTVTLATIVSSSSIAFNYFFCILLRIEKLRASLSSCVLLLAGGVALASYGSTSVHTLALAAALGSAVLSAARWVLSKRLLEQAQTACTTTAPARSNGSGQEYECSDERHMQITEGNTGHTLDALLTCILVIGPAAVLSLLPAVLAFELLALRAWPSEDHNVSFNGLARLGGTILGGGLLAFLLLFIEMEMVRVTSPLTLNVFGNLKHGIAIVLSVLLFGEHLLLVNSVGIVTTLAAAVAYGALKHSSGEASSPRRTHEMVQYTRVVQLPEGQECAADDDEDDDA